MHDDQCPHSARCQSASSHLSIALQLVIGGRNKYLINGHVAQPGRVQSMFHSVQLNVNNPHFLIMQGRITKVSTCTEASEATRSHPDETPAGGVDLLLPQQRCLPVATRWPWNDLWQTNDPSCFKKETARRYKGIILSCTGRMLLETAWSEAIDSKHAASFPAQVLNMKPAETLGMLEEAAGTRMYENKKEAALRTLAKKQVKVDDFNKVRSSVRGPSG